MRSARLICFRAAVAVAAAGGDFCCLFAGAVSEPLCNFFSLCCRYVLELADGFGGFRLPGRPESGELRCGHVTATWRPRGGHGGRQCASRPSTLVSRHAAPRVDRGQSGSPTLGNLGAGVSSGGRQHLAGCQSDRARGKGGGHVPGLRAAAHHSFKWCLPDIAVRWRRIPRPAGSRPAAVARRQTNDCLGNGTNRRQCHGNATTAKYRLAATQS